MSFYLKALAALAVTARAAPLADNSEYDFNACHGSNTAPEQIHLAYASDRGMTVSWNTPSHLSRPTVRFGSSKWNLNRYAWSDVSVTYPTSTTFSNHVTLTELQPDTVYYYVPQCGDVRNPYSFKTSRPAGKGEPFVFAYVADLGTMGADGLTTHVGTGAANPLKPGETNTIQSLTQFKSSYDFLWHCMFDVFILCSWSILTMAVLMLCSWRSCVCRLLVERGNSRLFAKHYHCRWRQSLRKDPE